MGMKMEMGAVGVRWVVFDRVGGYGEDNHVSFFFKISIV